MVINAPSLANSRLLNLGADVKEFVGCGVRFFHIDIMDGHYVSNLCFPLSVIRELKEEYPDITAEVHLMTDCPETYIRQLKEYGADWVSFHADSTSFALKALMMIKRDGMKAGIALNPSQRLDLIEPYQELLDYVVLMAVEPGVSGQRMLQGTPERLLALHQIRERCGLDFKIVIDGGVSFDNLLQLAENHADVLVTGNYTVYRQPDGIVGACRRFEEEVLAAGDSVQDV